MSKEHAEQFHAHLSSNEELRNKVSAASDQIMDLAKSHNLHFTREELAEVFKEKFSDSSSGSEGATPMTPFLSERPGI